MSRLWRRYLPALTLVLLIVVFVFLFNFTRQPELFTQGDATIIGSFIEWFGVLYGVMLALVVIEVWQHYSLINNEVDREADALTLLVKTARYLDDQNAVAELTRRVHDYAEAVLRENSGNARPHQADTNTQPDTDTTLNAIHAQVGAIVRANDHRDLLVAEMLHQFNDAFDARGDRLSYIRERLPKTLWLIVVFTSVVWLLGFFGLRIDSTNLALTMCGVTTFTISALLFIVADLNNPETGTWHTTFESFVALREFTGASQSADG